MSDWTGYRLVPEDLWFFRDGKPSAAGQDHYLRSIFPPFPSTLYGLIRTQRLLDYDLELSSLSETSWPRLPQPLRNEIGEWGDIGSLSLRGPWLLKNGDILLPAPLDLRLKVESGPDAEDQRAVDVVRLTPIDEPPSPRNWSHDLLPMVPDRAMKMDKRWESSSGWFLTIDGMKAWLAGGVPDLATIVCRRKVWVSESRTGVGLTNDRRRHEEHQLYTFGFIRLQKDVSLGFELSGGELPCGVVARFGGENRAATIERGPLLSDLFAERSGDSRGDRCTLTLLTPAIFSDGAFPKQGAVRSAVVPGPVLAGGWDLARRRPKPLRRAAPAGSVYWIDEDVPSILGPWEQQHRDAKEGFGLALAGQQPRRQRG